MDIFFEGFTDGTFVFQATEKPGHFLFYRADNQILENIDNEPMDMYQNYICQKMLSGEIKGVVVGEVLFEKFANERVIGIIAAGLTLEQREPKEKESGFVKKIIRKAFRK